MARKPDPRRETLKQAATTHLENGDTEFSLDVTGLARRERDILRMHINRWLRDHGLHGATRYVDEERERLTCRVLGPRQEQLTDPLG